ncbi:TonB-dependent receptor [Maribellus maritimus]|uniref:TonB-dependent receptor n=1 Tax=Maribellus maritimus TaxID=2870838 RepID=UPI001EEB66E5|nr:TonB-dependent receptor [Maribellus maritimus]MCG6190864.1 TonB-dependent receptor [Maribellus maritimus]
MKKKRMFYAQGKVIGFVQKIGLKMKLTLLLLLIGFLNLMASESYSQFAKLTISLKNATVEQVLTEIEKNSEFNFVYNRDAVDINRKVNVDYRDAKVNNILYDLFKDTGVNYHFIDRVIVLTTVSEAAAIEPQPMKVSGKVTDSSGTPLPGVTVLIKGTTNGTVTNASGEYSLANVSGEANLQFSFVGMRSQELVVNNRTEINVVMEDESIGIDEVVAIGYGTMKKNDLTGSVSSVASDDFKTTPLRDITNMLQGSVSGVEIVKTSGAPGSGSIVRIRGGNSMQGSNDPLYVVDGLPGGMVTNPNDIESVQILKDASATAIYGSRGANGVIIITTKRGKLNSNVNLNVYYGIQKVRNKLDILNAKEYAEFANEKANNIGVSPYYDINNLPGDTDWQDVAFRLAPSSNYNLSITGGNEMNKYGIFGNYANQKGIIDNSDYSIGSIRVNLDNKVSKWFNVATSIFASHAINNKANISTDANGLVYRVLVMNPIAPVYDENGDYYPVRTLATSEPIWDNPKAVIDGFYNHSIGNNFNGITNLEFNIFDGLTFGVRLGGRYSNSRNDTYMKRIMLNSPSGIASISESDSYQYLNENILSYKKNYDDKHELNITTGFTMEGGTSMRFNAGAEDFVVDDLLINSLSSGGTITTPGSSKTKYTMLSWLGRINYIYKNKYLFTITTRADGSSRLGENNKWGIFPSGAFAWRMSEENFIKNLSFISNLKLRTSYGTTGNQEIGLYNSLSSLSTVSALFGENEDRYIGFVPSSMPNADLKWEVTKQFNAGFDFGCLNQKIILTFDYYHKKTNDLLASVPLALSSGYGSLLKNFGDMKNEGVEFAVNSNIVENDEWSFAIGANFSLNRNKVLKVATSTGQFFAGSFHSPIDTYVNIIKEGYPLSSFWGYKEDGLWDSDQTDGSIQPTAKAGDQKYVDTNNSGLIDSDDKVILGSPYPDFIYGGNLNLRYKRISFYTLLQGSKGGLIFNATKFSIGDSFARNGNQMTEVKDHYSVDNPDVNAKYPRLSNVSPLISDRFFEDASYLRVKTISISYDLSFKQIDWIKSAMVYLSGENLFTLTKYSGYDPEVSSFGGSDLKKGIDYGAYPSVKTITCGININF